MSQPSQPVIGITSTLTRSKAKTLVCQVGQAYVTAIRKAGGLPLVIPAGVEPSALSALLPRLDGLLFTGGGDIDPQHFNGTSHPKVYDISPERDELELTLLKLALDAGKPLLAICRGIQVLNVACGGSLHTHIPDHLPNSMKHDFYPDFPRDKLAHTVSLTCDSLLHNIFNADDIQVNSLHHQGIARVGAGLEAIAYAPDGLVEGLVVKDAPFALGVQWHPECLPEDAGMQRLFRAFMTACQM